MTFRPAHWCALLAAAALALSGCGSSGPSDRDQIAALVKQEGTNPASLCRHLTDSLLRTLGGSSGCRRQGALASRDSTTHATSIRVQGKSATAVVVNRAGSRTISLVKQRGVWKLAGVG